MSFEVLPSYTPEVLPGYDLTPTTSHSTQQLPLVRARDRSSYLYVSEHMNLDLGPQKWGTRLPAYGRSGLVEGVVTVRSFKHVDRVVVRLVGKSVTSHILNNIPTISQTHILVHQSVELWSSAAACGSDRPTPTEFPFSFTLAGDNQPLPPSSSIQLRKANAYISYAIRVDMYRRGMHMHEVVQTEILHLPRTTSRYCRPFVPSADPTNEKRRHMAPYQWRRIAGPDPSAPSLLLPYELRFPSGETIPFIIPSSDRLAPGWHKSVRGEIELKNPGKEVSWEAPV
ncbi:hypothetical protein RhiJN_27536 [Ceratobasidium sp. AG-Ba]|nr:hypothetical protein RhiJN_27536 [Ceratobasidium sp. AG-Ba]